MKIKITDVTLREGNHTLNHQLPVEFVADLAKGLDAAGIDIIEVGHGDGLGGSSKQVGFAAATDEEYLRAAVGSVTTSQIGVMMGPGFATLDDIEMAAGVGVSVVRVAVHATEADVSQQYVQLINERGMTPIGHLVNCSMTTVDRLVEESKKLADYGVEAVVLADSVGELLPDGVAERVDRVRNEVGIDVGFHGHNSLGCAIANSLVAIEHGAIMVDGALRGMGGGAGNAQTENLVAVMERKKVESNADLLALLDLVDGVFAAGVDASSFPQIDSDTLMLGFSGVYGGYINPIRREAEKLNLDLRKLIMAVGERRLTAGQEDVIIQVARDLAKA